MKKPSSSITPADRFRRALTFEPLEQVPTCEVWFAHGEELLKRKLPAAETLRADPAGACRLFAEAYAEVAAGLEHSVFSLYETPFHDSKLTGQVVALFKTATKGTILVQALVGGGESTFSLNCDMGAGKDATAFAAALYEKPDEMHGEARQRLERAKERIKWMKDNGIDVVGFSNDYAFNNGPFISPRHFREFITPYLREQVQFARELGLLTYLHTDGNILPILEELASCGPHAFQSIDPTGGLDLAEVKARLAPHCVAVIGNVNCDVLERGAEEDIRAETLRAMTEGKPDGGFVLSSANCIYPGIPLANYRIMLEVWRKERYYEG